PALAMLATEMAALPRPRRRWLGGLLLVLLPSAGLGALYWWTVRGTENLFAPHAPRGGLILALVHTFHDFYAGHTHKSFWGLFGWTDTPLSFGDPRATAVIRGVLHVSAVVFLMLTLARLGRVSYRLVRVACQGRPAAALRAALSNPVLNSY